MFMVQGQIYYRIASLFPYDDEHQFLQVYFMGNEIEEIDRRCTIFEQINRNIIAELQQILHQHNELLECFVQC